MRKGPLTEKHKQNLSEALSGRILSKQHIDNLKKCVTRHHKDLDNTNNNDSNILYLSKSNHAKIHSLLREYAVSELTKKQIINFTNELLKQGIIREELSHAWRKLIKIFKLIQFGEVKIKIENGQPVSISSQAILSGKGDKARVKLIRKTIDLTK
ncbi:MAG: hypothetical protein ACFFAU_01635 [Candidatus Hodarchaeota archaeon]